MAGWSSWLAVLALTAVGLVAAGGLGAAPAVARPPRRCASWARRTSASASGWTAAADALKELADALDDALDRLAAGYESQRRFAANASHELRTPLAVQRLLTEVAMEDPDAGEDLRKLGAQLLRTNERNEKLIEGLLVLAESDRGLPGKVPVRLDELAGTVLDAHRELAGKHEVTLRRKLRERQVPGDPVLLERLITNLVSNAIKYNEPGGWVEVEVADEPPGRHSPCITPASACPPRWCHPLRTVPAAGHRPGAADAAAWAWACPSSAPSPPRTRARSGSGRAPRAALSWRSACRGAR